MLSISNIYGHGFSEELVNKLREQGFEIRPEISTFAGSQILRFVDFFKGPAMELIDLESEQEYLDFLPPGMVPFCPGISIMLPNEPKKELSQYKGDLSKWKPYILNDEYDGSTVSYLNFEYPIV